MNRSHSRVLQMQNTHLLSASSVKYCTCTQHISGLSHKQCTSILVPSKLFLQIYFCDTHILYVKELSLWWNKGLRNTISHYSIYWKLCILDIQYLWFKPSISFHNPQVYQFLKQCVEFCTLSITIYDISYNFLRGHSHRLVSNYKYTERPNGSSHYVRGCHQISIMLLVTEIWFDNAQYSLFA